MMKKLTKAKVEVPSVESGPLSNIDRLRTHLNDDSLAVKLLDAWKASDPKGAKPKLLKTVDDFFGEEK